MKSLALYLYRFTYTRVSNYINAVKMYIINNYSLPVASNEPIKQIQQSPVQYILFNENTFSNHIPYNKTHNNKNAYSNNNDIYLHCYCIFSAT